MYTCTKCSPLGYFLNPSTSKCECNAQQGFYKDQTSLSCKCRSQTYHIGLYDDQLASYSFAKDCATCSEIFSQCQTCSSSEFSSTGAVKFINAAKNDSSLYLKCSSCAQTYFYDESLENCRLCSNKHGAGCLTCSQSSCLTCESGYYLQGTRCVECGRRFDNCGRCTPNEC
mmetsp:Transcript_3408/g.5755  ORF Transcript_3408/g.5755 Transcript_3408/m.5755 type:complete len:171 (+) Transcript_3408:2464-2976(+)